MIVAKGCAPDVMVLIAIPQEFIFIASHVIYTSRIDTAYPLHQHELLLYSDH
jgi:hypothetical protein